jgi:NAD(P)H-hydrate epimerase
MDVILHYKLIIMTEYSITKEIIRGKLKPRAKESHKGDYGHALIIAGGKGKIGSAVLATKACLRSGVGLLTTHIPACGEAVLQTSIHEAMISLDNNDKLFSDNIGNFHFKTIAFGPGLGTAVLTQKAIHHLLKVEKIPMVIDADGLNCISLNKEWFNLIPENSILTPHPGEFERLVGPWETLEDRTRLQIDFAKRINSIVVVKGGPTYIAAPDGSLYVNTTGNPGMAKGGSGDALTGMITAFLSQNYSSLDAAILGVYIHGLAGDKAVVKTTEYGLLASDLIEAIPEAIKEIL